MDWSGLGTSELLGQECKMRPRINGSIHILKKKLKIETGVMRQLSNLIQGANTLSLSPFLHFTLLLASTHTSYVHRHNGEVFL